MEVVLFNRPLVASVVAMLVAQFVKPFIVWLIEQDFDPRLFFSTGGMPSSHTAAVVALTSSIFITEGVHSMVFAIAFVFSAITIHDAMGIRRAAGRQAQVINDWSRILAQIHADGQFTVENLKTMLGHNFLQVLFGMLLGLFCGIFFTTLV